MQTTITETNQERMRRIVDILCEADSFRDQLGIISNVLISLGVYAIRGDGAQLTAEQAVELILRDREAVGETVANATALQGLLMNQWLSREN